MRIELSFDREGLELVDELKLLTGIKSHKEFFNNTVTLFDWAVLQHLLGRIVTSMDEEKKDYKQLVMPSLLRASRLDDADRRAATERRMGRLTMPSPADVSDLLRHRAARSGN